MHLQPGDPIKRTDLHDQYGGSGQGGINPSTTSPNVFVFTDPATGVQHGYVDGWQADGCFHYTGAGQRGDQKMIRGNKAILLHEQGGRALRLIEGSRGTVTYVGQFTLDSDEPWYETDAPETGDGPLRKVIVFRMRPVDTKPQTASDSDLSPISEVLEGPVVTNVPIENKNTEKAWTNPKAEPIEAERREAILVHDYKAHLVALGRTASRNKVVPPGEHKPMYTDVHDETQDVLIEAKGTTTREALRMALGQLVDYGRFVHTTYRAVLLPERPRPDLLALAATQDVEVIWQTPTGFEATSSNVL